MTSDFLIGHPFITLQQVGSTNNYATGLVHAGMAQNGTAVFAHHQTAGKGQHHRRWLGEGGKNIALSVILQPRLTLSQSFLLSMAMALGSHRFVANYTKAGTSVKWPNDLYWNDRKAGGILIENIVQGADWKYAIVGIGLNVNQTGFDELEGKAVSLKQITGGTHEPLLLAKELCGHLSEAYELLTQSPAAVVDAYQEVLYKRNQSVRLKKGSRVFEAVIQEVTPLGELVVMHATEERFAVGEVEWLIA